MKTEQEPKYEIRDGKLHNRQDGKQIPDDEPVFILRAKDRLAAATLEHYLQLVRDAYAVHPGSHPDAVRLRLEQFQRYADTHPTRTPDTVLTKDWEDL